MCHDNIQFKEWILKEAGFKNRPTDLSRVPTQRQGLGDLRQRRRWGNMDGDIQPGYQRAAAAALGGFGDAFRNVLAGDDGQGLPGSPMQLPTMANEKEEPLDFNVFVDEDYIQRHFGELIDTSEYDPNELHKFKNVIIKKAYEEIRNSKDTINIKNKYDLANPRVYDFSHHNEDQDKKGVKAHISFDVKKYFDK